MKLQLLYPILMNSSIYEMSRLCTSRTTTPLIAFNIISAPFRNFFKSKGTWQNVWAIYKLAILHFKNDNSKSLHNARLQFLHRIKNPMWTNAWLFSLSDRQFIPHTWSQSRQHRYSKKEVASVFQYILFPFYFFIIEWFRFFITRDIKISMVFRNIYIYIN